MGVPQTVTDIWETSQSLLSAEPEPGAALAQTVSNLLSWSHLNASLSFPQISTV